jgi:hypothetical protein
MADTPAKQKFNVSKIVTITKVIEVESASAGDAEASVKGASDGAESEVGTVILSRTETKYAASAPRQTAAARTP